MAGYAEDLAHIHDTAYSAHAAMAAPAIARWLHAAGITRGLLVDLGCGGGHSSRCFVDAGFEVLGIDLSEPLVARARRRVPEARFEVDSFVDAELPPCVAVVAISEVLNYALDPRNGRRALAGLFERAFAALAPGGLLAFDVLGPSRATGTSRSWQEGDDWAALVERDEAPAADRLSRRIVHFRRLADGCWRRGEERHEVLLLPEDEVLADLRAAGFDARTRRGYGRRRFQPGSAVYVARRP